MNRQSAEIGPHAIRPLRLRDVESYGLFLSVRVPPG
jgi:hypothetical protein